MEERHSTPRRGGAEHLVPLRSLAGFALAADEADVRGWPVLDARGETLGVVAELLVDPRLAEVEALAVDVRSSIARDGAARPAVLPITRAHIDDARRVVTTDLTRDELRLPRPSRASGAEVAHAAAHPDVTVERTADGEEVIRVPIVREELVVERRPVVQEVVVIRKRAVQDDRTVEADLRREEVHVERDDAPDARRDPDR